MTTTHQPRSASGRGNSGSPLTTEGYSVLHQMMRVRWPAWRALPAAEKSRSRRKLLERLPPMEEHSPGQSALFSLIGHKGDLMLIHFRESFADLNQAELQLANLRLSDYLSRRLLIFDHRTWPVRLDLEDLQRADRSRHRAALRSMEGRDRVQTEPPQGGDAPASIPRFRRNRYACFYPMDRRRGEDKNWYTSDRRTCAADE